MMAIEPPEDLDAEECPGCVCCTIEQCHTNMCPATGDGRSLCPCTEPYDGWAVGCRAGALSAVGAGPPSQAEKDGIDSAPAGRPTGAGRLVVVEKDHRFGPGAPTPSSSVGPWVVGQARRPAAAQLPTAWPGRSPGPGVPLSGEGGAPAGRPADQTGQPVCCSPAPAVLPSSGHVVAGEGTCGAPDPAPASPVCREGVGGRCGAPAVAVIGLVPLGEPVTVEDLDTPVCIEHYELCGSVAYMQGATAGEWVRVARAIPQEQGT